MREKYKWYDFHNVFLLSLDGCVQCMFFFFGFPFVPLTLFLCKFLLLLLFFCSRHFLGIEFIYILKLRKWTSVVIQMHRRRSNSSSIKYDTSFKSTAVDLKHCSVFDIESSNRSTQTQFTDAFRIYAVFFSSFLFIAINVECGVFHWTDTIYKGWTRDRARHQKK